MYFASGLVCRVGWPFSWCWSPSHWVTFSYGLYRCVTCFARCLLLLPLRQWHLNNLCSLELRSTSLLWTWFCNKFTFRYKLWDVWDDLCCNLWAHLRVGVVCAILEEHGFNRGFTRGTTVACRFGSELLSNEDQCAPGPSFFGGSATLGDLAAEIPHKRRWRHMKTPSPKARRTLGVHEKRDLVTVVNFYTPTFENTH